MSGLDDDLNSTMDALFNALAPLLPDTSPEGIRCLIVSSNLRGLAEGFLQLEESGEPLNLKNIALGLLGTADWLRGTLDEAFEI